MKVLETGDWSLLLPAEWYAERESDSILVADRDGIGCLQISELRRDSGGGQEAALQDDLTAVKALLDEDCDWQRVTCGRSEIRVRF